MKSSLAPASLQKYVLSLVKRQFPDGYEVPYPLKPFQDMALARLEHCFSRINRKYYRDANDSSSLFDHLNGDHFASYLYFLGNTIWRESGDTELPTRLFYLNRCMHGLDLFYSVSMPDIFMLVHPLGTVIGNATYQDYMVVYQNVTIGSDDAGNYPCFGKGTVLYAKSSIIGRCHLGDNVTIGANSFLLNATIPHDSLVVGVHPANRIIPSTRQVIEAIFQAPLAHTVHSQQ